MASTPPCARVASVLVMCRLLAHVDRWMNGQLTRKHKVFQPVEVHAIPAESGSRWLSEWPPISRPVSHRAPRKWRESAEGNLYTKKAECTARNTRSYFPDRVSPSRGVPPSNRTPGERRGRSTRQLYCLRHIRMQLKVRLNLNFRQPKGLDSQAAGAASTGAGFFSTGGDSDLEVGTPFDPIRNDTGNTLMIRQHPRRFHCGMALCSSQT